jgi:hypothetical protein
MAVIRNKRGVVDVLTVALVLFVIAFVTILVLKILGAFTAELQNTDAVPESKTAATDSTAAFANGFDQAIVAALALSYIVLLILANQVGTNSGWFFLALIILLILLGVVAILSQVFDAVTNNNDFVTERAAMPATVWIMDNLLILSIIGGVLLLFALYSGKDNGGTA